MASEDESIDDRRVTPSTIATAAVAFFWRNRRYVARDLLVALGWVLALSAVFVVTPLPGWLYYLLLFGGLLVYSFVMSLVGATANLGR